MPMSHQLSAALPPHEVWCKSRAAWTAWNCVLSCRVAAQARRRDGGAQSQHPAGMRAAVARDGDDHSSAAITWRPMPP